MSTNELVVGRKCRAKRIRRMTGVKCIRCRHAGTVGIDIVLRPDGVVPGSNMLRFVALCNDCIRKEN